MKRTIALFFAVACTWPAASAAPQHITNGEQLIAAMHARYEHSWYRNVTFEEQAITRNADGTSKTETWYEPLQLPGKLRINIGSPTSGNGVIFRDNTLTSFRDGKISATRPFVHMLLVLGFDVYRQDPKVTITESADQKFDLSKIHKDTWDGKDIYVVGAEQGDLKSRQFWINKDRLLFVRLIQPNARDASKTDDQRFSDYRRLPVGWIAARVEFYTDGANVFTEQYSNIKENGNLDPSQFDPQKFDSH